MKGKDLEKVIARLDKKNRGAFPEELDRDNQMHLRALLEIAYQMSLLNEKGISVHN